MQELLDLSKEKAKELLCRESPWNPNCRTLVFESLFDPTIDVQDLSILATPQSPYKPKDSDDSDDSEFSYTIQRQLSLI